jgi:hypothetical protein
MPLRAGTPLQTRRHGAPNAPARRSKRAGPPNAGGPEQEYRYGARAGLGVVLVGHVEVGQLVGEPDRRAAVADVLEV